MRSTLEKLQPPFSAEPTKKTAFSSPEEKRPDRVFPYARHFTVTHLILTAMLRGGDYHWPQLWNPRIRGQKQFCQGHTAHK